MKIKLICIFFFSVIFSLSQAQSNIEESSTWKYKPNFLIGVDVLNAGLSAFSDNKLYQGFVSTHVYKKLHLVSDVGYESNVYLKNGYDAIAKGTFVRLGAFYMSMRDPENEMNGFYFGGKLAASFYNQEYKAIPIRGYGGSSSSQAFPSSSQSSYWVEGTIGGRIELFETNLFIDLNVQPKYLIYSTKQNDIEPMIVPGFGQSSGKFNFGFMWSIGYYFK